jgi:predicted transcriptional regulator
MGRKLHKAQRIEKMRQAWELAQSGTPQQKIAADLGISQGQVSKYLSLIGRIAMDRLAERAMFSRILALDHAEVQYFEAMQAFERSKRSRKKQTAKKSMTPTSTAGSMKEEASGGQSTLEVIDRDGDPAWIGKAMDAIRLHVDLIERFVPTESDETDDAGDGTVAGALIAEAERRNEAYRCTEVIPNPSTSDSDPTEPSTIANPDPPISRG